MLFFFRVSKASHITPRRQRANEGRPEADAGYRGVRPNIRCDPRGRPKADVQSCEHACRAWRGPPWSRQATVCDSFVCCSMRTTSFTMRSTERAWPQFVIVKKVEVDTDMLQTDVAPVAPPESKRSQISLAFSFSVCPPAPDHCVISYILKYSYYVQRVAKLTLRLLLPVAPPA